MESPTLRHLPGCDLRHTERQRCSTWTAPGPPPATRPLPASRPLYDDATHTAALQEPFRGVVFKTLLAVNLAWTVLLGIAALVTHGGGGNSCRTEVGPVELWMLGEVLLAPPLVIVLGVGLVGRERRRPASAWIGLAVLLLTMCALLIALAIGRWTEPTRCSMA